MSQLANIASDHTTPRKRKKEKIDEIKKSNLFTGKTVI